MNIEVKADNTLGVMRAAWVITAIFILSNAATPLYGIWQDELGFASGILTVIFGCYILGLLMTLIVAGQLSDHYGRKAMLLPCIVIAIAAAVLFEAAQSVFVLMLARFLTGVSVGIVVSAGMANVVEQTSSHRKHFASLMASVAMVAGAGSGPLLAGVIAHYYADPIRLVFSTEILLLLLALVAVLRQPHRKLDTGTFRPKLPSIPKQSIGIVLLGVTFFGPGITATSFVLSLGPKMLATFLHTNQPLLSGVMAFFMFLTAVLVQFAMKPFSVKKMFLLSGLSTILSMLSLWVALHFGSATWLLVGALFAGAGQGLGQLGGLTLIADNVSANRRAEANAIFNIGGYIPAGIIPVATGYLIEFFGLEMGVTALACFIASSALLALGGLAKSARVA
ncbi:MFS transporter [Pseudomonas sp. PD9R]|uniref:MFS transporter n=1 Tax=Pseudomonas sp. PD9R TaxID=2853534 RepID=UPI001C461B7B|nr:MFS transporter [Pseudomonas sp. PD9R]MBV6823475.1 MFS transporter [Pseudomonas sp. PD9R]